MLRPARLWHWLAHGIISMLTRKETSMYQPQKDSPVLPSSPLCTRPHSKKDFGPRQFFLTFQPNLIRSAVPELLLPSFPTDNYGREKNPRNMKNAITRKTTTTPFGGLFRCEKSLHSQSKSRRGKYFI